MTIGIGEGLVSPPGSGGGAPVQTYATLAAFEAELPLSDGTIWRIDSPLAFGTIIDGEPSPDPRVPSPRLLISRNVRRLGAVVSPQPLTYIEVV